MMKNMIRENAYIECPQLMYWRIVQSIIEDLKTPGLKVNGLRYDEHIFARFCLLAASALGNCTWESSFKDLFRLTLADFKPILSGIHHLEGYGCYLSVPRKKTNRPIFMNRFVEMSLIVVVIHCLHSKPTRNNAMNWLGDNYPICPFPIDCEVDIKANHESYHLRILETYLNYITSKLGYKKLHLAQYVDTGRLIQVDIYDQDVLLFIQGNLKTTTCLPSEYSDPQLFMKMEKTWNQILGTN